MKKLYTNNVKCKEQILNLINHSSQKITSQEIYNKLSSYKTREIKLALKNLIDEGELLYTYEFGCTFVERSFNKPVRISSRIVLTPPHRNFSLKTNEIAIILNPGSAFGGGQHPTTRMALKCIDYAFSSLISDSPKNIIDIGTGSGVLAIGAVKLGARKAFATDLDNCAIFEAKNNISLNDLDNKITVENIDFQDIKDEYDIIIANLRLPGLVELGNYFKNLLSRNGIVIVSGIKTDELARLIKEYSNYGIVNIYSDDELDWSCGIFGYSNLAKNQAKIMP